jgi:hypothetical protein
MAYLLARTVNVVRTASGTGAKSIEKITVFSHYKGRREGEDF